MTFKKGVSGASVAGVATGVNDESHVTLVLASVAATFTGTVTPGDAWLMGRDIDTLPDESAEPVCTLCVLV